MKRNRHDSRKRHLACFTIAQDEPYFLPRWVAHYTGQTGMCPEDVYVLHHTEVRGWAPEEIRALEDSFVRVVPVHRAVAFDHDWLRGTVADFCRFLLRSYEWVLFSEVDELVLPDPRRSLPWGHLAHYLAYNPEVEELDSIGAVGYEVVQQPGEKPLDRSRRPLAQRGYWYQSAIYSKTLLTRVPLEWGPGFHQVWIYGGATGRVLTPAPPDGLILVHLHKVDRMVAVERIASARRRPWNPADLEAGRGWQNRASNEELDRYWSTNIDTGQPLDSLEPIPEALRAIM